MFARPPKRLIEEGRALTTVFAALGDETRLDLLKRLAEGQPRSISNLANGFPSTRQAITRHLEVLEAAGLVGRERRGRETLFSFQLGRLVEAKSYLQEVAETWELALGRLKAFVENAGPDAHP